MRPTALFFLLGLTVSFQNVFAGAPKVGKKAAARYFQGEVQSSADSQTPSKRNPSNIETLAPDEHFLTFGFSHYLNSDSYRWGPAGSEEKVGEWGLDMMYRIRQFSNTFDEAIRVSYNEFDVSNYRASKLGFMYALTLPEAGSQFPLYFGAAAGAGVFLKQFPEESPLSFDYQLYLGLRLFNVIEKTGFYVEGGLKNHLLITTDGQFNGTYLAAGAVFTF